jgi:hypothetical protein
VKSQEVEEPARKVPPSGSYLTVEFHRIVLFVLVPGGIPSFPLGLPDGTSSGMGSLLGQLSVEPIPPHAKLRVFVCLQGTS